MTTSLLTTPVSIAGSWPTNRSAASIDWSTRPKNLRPRAHARMPVRAVGTQGFVRPRYEPSASADTHRRPRRVHGPPATSSRRKPRTWSTARPARLLRLPSAPWGRRPNLPTMMLATVPSSCSSTGSPFNRGMWRPSWHALRTASAPRPLPARLVFLKNKKNRGGTARVHATVRCRCAARRRRRPCWTVMASPPRPCRAEHGRARLWSSPRPSRSAWCADVFIATTAAPAHGITSRRLDSARTMQEQGMRPVAEQMAARMFGPGPARRLTQENHGHYAGYETRSGAQRRARTGRTARLPAVPESAHRSALVSGVPRLLFTADIPASWPAACPTRRS